MLSWKEHQGLILQLGLSATNDVGKPAVPLSFVSSCAMNYLLPDSQ